MDGYIVYLDDLSEGARELAAYSRLTHILPFISCAAVGDGGFLRSPSFRAANAVRTVRVSVVMDKVKSAVGYERTAPEPFCGRGVTAAVIDTGLSPHVDFLLPHRVPVFVDLIGGKSEPYDDNGHGTAVAGALAGSGLMSGGRYSGIACGADIIPIKALDASGEGSTADILQAMQWIYTNCEKYNIRVVCMSFGAEPQGKNDPLAAGAEALHSKGITVVASSGNDGPAEGSVKSPGISPFALTVGGAEVTDAGVTVSEFSSRGRPGGIVKPDIIAPAEDVVCAGAGEDYVAVTGTSIATPIVAGACALILSAHPGYTPDKVKELLMTHAAAVEGAACGSGMLDMTFLRGIT